jgi:hypothetical protein
VGVHRDRSPLIFRLLLIHLLDPGEQGILLRELAVRTLLLAAFALDAEGCELFGVTGPVQIQSGPA